MAPMMKRLWIRKNFALGIALLFYVLSAFYLSMFPMVYKATAYVDFFPYAYDLSNADNLTRDTQINPALFAEEEALIRTPDFLAPIIQKWTLAERPEYNPVLKHQKFLPVLLQSVHKFLIPENEDELPLDEAIFKQVNDNLFFRGIPYSEIQITVTSPAPWVAEGLVNAIAQSYSDVKSVHGTKKFQKKAPRPEHPDLEQYKKPAFKLVLIGFFLGIFAALFIKPTQRVSSQKV
jgi:uncharacterized protein involved in exopolysaccharide biosynthesis